MKKLSKKKWILITVSVALALTLAVGVSLKIYAYQQYHEEAIPAEVFLPRPDKITVYYKNGESFKIKNLRGDNVDIVYDAFQSLLSKSTRAGRTPYYTPWDETKYLSQRETYNYIEFHYKQRYKFAYCTQNPQRATEPTSNPEDIFSFTGEFDSVCINHPNLHGISFIGCKNGVYQRNDTVDGNGYFNFSQESADAFWETVMSLVK